MAPLTNKTALVTGGTSGIGAASVKALATAGASVLFTGRRDERGNALQEELTSQGHAVTFFRSDVTNPEQVGEMVEAVLDTYGGLDIAFNNAGVSGDLGPLHEQSADNFALVMDVNVRGLWLSMKEEIKAMLATGGGSIINSASVGGHVGFPGGSIYAASKHAVMGLTRTAALEYATAGIRVNALSPGAIRTEMLERVTGGAEEAMASFSAMHPVGRVGEASEIADGLVFLAGDQSSFVTGQSLTIDGGWTAQ